MSKKWILIRGLGHERGHWGSFVCKMKQHFPQDQVILVDLAGSGVHYQRQAPLSVQGLMEKIRKDALLASTPPFHTLSMSLGSMVAYEWAHNYPQEISAQALMNTSFSLSPFYKRLCWKVYPRFFLGQLQPNRKKQVETLLPIISSQTHFSNQLISERVKILENRPVSTYNRFRQLMAAAFYKGGKTPPSVPTLILSSKGDRLCNPCCSQAIASEWNVDNIVHPTGGHDLTLDDEEWVINEVKKWMLSIRNNINSNK